MQEFAKPHIVILKEQEYCWIGHPTILYCNLTFDFTHVDADEAGGEDDEAGSDDVAQKVVASPKST